MTENKNGAKLRCYQKHGGGGKCEGLASVLDVAPWPDIMLTETNITDKKYSCWLWCQTLKPSFNDTFALFVGQINYRTHGQFKWDLTWFCFCFDFVLSHAPCGCCSIVCWRGWGRSHSRSRRRKNSGCRWTEGVGLKN